jgi:trk system potassium uptake protein TrkH
MWRHRDVVDLRRRTLPQDVVRSAFVILLTSLGVVFLSTLLLLAAQPQLKFEELAFDAVSAFGTVGLSTGVTTEISSFGRAVLCATMFVGRLGPLSLMVLLTRRRRALAFRYAEESVAVG